MYAITGITGKVGGAVADSLLGGRMNTPSAPANAAARCVASSMWASATLQPSAAQGAPLASSRRTAHTGCFGVRPRAGLS
jgi:hypothetical protein